MPFVPTLQLAMPERVGVGLIQFKRLLTDGFIADDHAADGQPVFLVPEMSNGRADRISDLPVT